MEFVTVSTVGLGDDSPLRRSCDRFGIDLKVLGVGCEHDPNYMYKLRLVQEYLQLIDGDELLLYTDGWDTFFCAYPDEIIAKFHRLGCPVVFSAEKNIWPPVVGDHPIAYPSVPTAYRYLNAGGFLGVAGRLQALIEKARPLDCYEMDQHLWSDCYLCNPGAILLDHQCSIFQTLFDPAIPHETLMPELALRDGRWHNVTTGTAPCVVHGNGPFCEAVNQMFERTTP